MPDRRGKDRGRRLVAVLRCARLENCRHRSGLQLFRRICTAETPPVQRDTAARARATAKSAAGAAPAGTPRERRLQRVPIWGAQRPLSPSSGELRGGMERSERRRFRPFGNKEEICRVRMAQQSLKFSSPTAHRDLPRTCAAARN
jgi:hypothetical protein